MRWWLATPRFRRLQVPPTPAPAGQPGLGLTRMGIRYVATLMHRTTIVAAVRDGYVVPDGPYRADVLWTSKVFREICEVALMQAASHYRAKMGGTGPVDTAVLTAEFLFMLFQWAGELAYHPDFALGARRHPPRVTEDPVGESATWIFGDGPAEGIKTVAPAPD